MSQVVNRSGVRYQVSGD